MPGSRTKLDSAGVGPEHFASTHWSVVLNARDDAAPQARAALETLCRAYWYPLYGWLRRQGYGMHDAQDLTQSFFGHLLANQNLQRVDRTKGKFRSFLLASLKNFVANEWDRSRALKRGVEFSFVSVDEEFGEDRLRRGPSHDSTPDKAFEQSWALTLLDAVLARLRTEYEAAGKADLFDTLQGYLSGNRGGTPYAETAARLNLTEGAVKMGVSRLRRRFGELLRTEIAQTVSSPQEINEEIRCLFAAVNV